VCTCLGSQVSKCKGFNMHRWVAGWVVGWRRYTITNVSGETENAVCFLCLWGHWLRLHVASKAHACYGAVSFGAVGRGFKSHRARHWMMLPYILLVLFSVSLLRFNVSLVTENIYILLSLQLQKWLTVSSLTSVTLGMRRG